MTSIAWIPLLVEDRRAPTAADDRPGCGCLLVTRGTRRLSLPLRSVSFAATVAERIAEVTVEQVFENSYDELLEAVYIFPLPGGAAVSRFELHVGDKQLVGIVEERGEARRQYQQAIAEGRKAALLEQERDDVFTVKVGNLPPRSRAKVKMVYSERLPAFDDGETELRIPLVVAPRYIPGDPLERASTGDGVESDTTRVPDASRISPPRLAPGMGSDVALSIDVALLGESEIQDLGCTQHATKLGAGTGKLTVKLAKKDELLDRDFVLKWKSAATTEKPLLYVTRKGDHVYGCLSIVPPREVRAGAGARDVLFLLDRSGSMQGQKLDSAKRAVSALLSTLAPQDRFALCAFDTGSQWFAPSAAGGLERAPATVAELSGSIDASSSPSVRQTIENLAANGARRIVLDCSRVKYANSAGLGMLVKAADALRSRGGALALVRVPAKIKIVIEMLGLNAFFDICPDSDSALKVLSQRIGASQRPAPGFAPVDAASLTAGLAWLGRVGAGGGTELLPALEESLDAFEKLGGGDSGGRLPVVVLVTDGQVGNEGEILRRIESRAAGLRVFTLGIDTAVNAAFLRRLAQIGRGTATLCEPGPALEGALERIGREIGTPVLVDLAVEDQGLGIDQTTLTPARLPDVFAGRTASVFFRCASANGSVRIRARRASGGTFEQVVTAEALELASIPQLWGKSRVADLEDEYRVAYGGGTEGLERARGQILALALEHQLLTRFTSFLVVDRDEADRRLALSRRTIVQAVEQPKGWADQSKRERRATPPTGAFDALSIQPLFDADPLGAADPFAAAPPPPPMARRSAPAAAFEDADPFGAAPGADPFGGAPGADPFALDMDPPMGGGRAPVAKKGPAGGGMARGGRGGAPQTDALFGDDDAFDGAVGGGPPGSSAPPPRPAAGRVPPPAAFAGPSPMAPGGPPPAARPAPAPGGPPPMRVGGTPPLSRLGGSRGRDQGPSLEALVEALGKELARVLQELEQGRWVADQGAELLRLSRETLQALASQGFATRAARTIALLGTQVQALGEALTARKGEPTALVAPARAASEAFAAQARAELAPLLGKGGTFWESTI